MTNDSTPSSPYPDDDGRRRRLPLVPPPGSVPTDLGALRHAELVRAQGCDVLVLFFAYLPTDPLTDCFELTLRALEIPHN